MNAINLLTMLSGSVGNEGHGRLLQSEDKGGADFAATLMTQLELLAQSGTSEISALPLKDFAELKDYDSELLNSMQEIAVLLGNKLPDEAHIDQEIDIDKTMSTLHEVLSHIEAATGSSALSLQAHGKIDRADSDEAVISVPSAGEKTLAAQGTMMPLQIAKNPDETLSEADANTKARHEEHKPDSEFSIADDGRNTPDLIKKLLQNGEELNHGKSLIDDQRDVAQNKAAIDGKSLELQVKPEVQSSNSEKKIAAVTDADKPVPKMALEMAQLHRQIAGQTKIEIPAMSKPMMHSEWDQELGDRIVWMNNRAMPFAELRLNPQHLGPITIRIDMDDLDQATIAFSAQHASVKEAIEAAIPKLREMMGAQQLNVAEINVTQASLSDPAKLPGFGQAHQQHNDGGRKNGRGGSALDDSNNASSSGEDTDENAIVGSGIVNIFA